MLREADLPHLDYHGFVEGDDLGKGTVDVIVTEGFTGNIALKTAEGTAKQIGQYIRDAMNHSWSSRIGYFFARRRFSALREKMDPGKVNGGVFLGLDGVVIKSHGGADAEGFAGAIEVGYDMVRHELLGKIREMIAPSQRGGRPSLAARSGQFLKGQSQDCCRSHRTKPPLASFRRARRRRLSAGARPDQRRTRQTVDTSDEWIVSSAPASANAISPRQGETTSHARHQAAAGRARRRPASTAADIDLVIVATSTPDYTFPAVATQVQAESRHPSTASHSICRRCARASSSP